MPDSIFFNIALPNDATWFYFSLLLVVALFFKFSRFLSIRNWDVLMFFVLVPGLLLLREDERNWFGYLWLLCGSAYFLVRCLFDLALVRRPALSPNLNFGGLAWLAGSLFVCLVTVAYRPPDKEDRVVGKVSVPVDQVQAQGEHLLENPAMNQEPFGFDKRF